jgi:hypothetical protein
MTVVEKVLAAIETDTHAASWTVAQEYQRASLLEQRTLDRVFIALCGWSLRTLLQDGPMPTGEEDFPGDYTPYFDEQGAFLA